MGIMNQVGDEALLGQLTTTTRRDEETIITDHESSDDEMKGDEKGLVEKKGLSEKSVYLDESAGMWKCRDCIWTYQIRYSSVDHIQQTSFNFAIRGTEIEWSLSKENPGVVDVENIPKVLNSIINKALILDGSSQNEGDTSLEGSTKGNLKIDLVEDDEEEVLELEFERAVGKMHTHNIYCPNCSSQVTRVILRRKKPQIKDPRDKPMGLLGCLSCFSIFIPSGNTLNPFRCFGSEKPEITQEHPLPAPINDNDETIVKKGRVFDLFWIFGKRDGNDINKTPSSEPGKDLSEHEEGDLDEPLLRTKSRLRPQHGTPPAIDDQDDINKGDAHDQHQPPLGELPQVSPPRSDLGGDEHIIEFPQTQVPLVRSPSGPGYFEHGSKSLEIIKSIVYGGLVESITSLSIVTSAAASETATMNIVALGLANVISGVFIVAHNLRSMKNETPVPNSNEQTDRYQELIGKRDNFLLHFTFAILSFLLFGLIPPAVYGFAFEKTENKDYTIIAVAIASLICIILLSIGKAYCNGEHKFSTYIKTISYYVSNAVAVSGVAYAMGDLIKIVAEKLGWFAPSTPTPATLVNYGVNSGTTFMASS